MENDKEQLINAVVNGIEKLATDSIGSVSGSVSKYGPQVLDTAENYIRVIAIIKSIPWLILLVVSICIIKNSIRTHKKYSKMSNNYDYDYKDKKTVDWYTGVNFFVSILCAIMIIISILLIFNLDNILSIVSPKLELIKMAKDSITSHISSK